MHLIYFMERAAGDDKWYHRQDITDKTPGEWLADTMILRSEHHIVLVSATPISEAEAGAIERAALANLAKRKARLEDQRP